jgi:hypothetical protein
MTLIVIFLQLLKPIDLALSHSLLISACAFSVLFFGCCFQLLQLLQLQSVHPIEARQVQLESSKGIQLVESRIDLLSVSDSSNPPTG